MLSLYVHFDLSCEIILLYSALSIASLSMQHGKVWHLVAHLLLCLISGAAPRDIKGQGPRVSTYYERQGLKDSKARGGMYGLRVVRPEGISWDQGNGVSMYYKWRGLKGKATYIQGTWGRNAYREKF